jgi:N-acetylglucosamine repressor
LAREMRVSKPTVSSVVADLMDEDVVREVGFGESTGGRKPMMLRLGGEAKLVVGVEIDSAECKLALVDLDGTVLRLLELPVTGHRPSEIVELVAGGIGTLLDGRNARALLGCGVGVPGLMNTEGDTVIYANLPGWENVPLKELLSGQLGVPVTVTDRGKAAALGAFWIRGRERQEDLIYIYMGTGVGGGIILQGDLRLGINHTAGELGHTTVVPDGPLCKCGNRGCLETFVSGPAIEMRARAKIKAGLATSLARRAEGQGLEAITAKQVADAAQQGDELALEILQETAEYLAVVVANLINALNPQTVIIGGPVSRWHGLLVPAVKQAVARRALYVACKSVQGMPQEAEDRVVPMGAAALVIRDAGELLAGHRAESKEVDSRTGGAAQAVVPTPP